MTITDTVREHEARCVPHLVRLRMLAREPAGMPLPSGLAGAVGVAVDAVMTEAEASGRAMIRESAGRGPSGYLPLLAARLDRLGRAAWEAVVSARDGDGGILRERLHRFDAMAAAMWTVQLSVCEPRDGKSRPGRDGMSPCLA